MKSVPSPLINLTGWGLLLSTAWAAAQVSPTLATGAAGSSEADIHDIRGPVHLTPSWEWVIWLATGLLMLTAVAGLWWWLRQRPKVQIKLAHEIALERLRKVRQWMETGKGREFSIEVSEVARVYIEERFQVLAARRTTEEFLYDLISSSDIRLTAHRPLLADFLRHCDLAKFAGWTLTMDEMESMYQCVEQFIRATAEQRPETAPSTASAAAANQV